MPHRTQGPSLLPLQEHELRLFCGFLEKQTGLQFTDPQRRSTIEGALQNRLGELGITSFLDYYDFLIRGDPRRAELRRLVDLLAITETSFFRNFPQFEVLRYEVIPRLIEARKNTTRLIRIWSAGCSTGEEPFSIVMVLLDLLPDPAEWRLEIMGTDISQHAIWAAQAAVYSQRSVRAMPFIYQKRYLEKRPDGKLKLSRDIRNRVHFQISNLVHDAPPFVQPIDIIFCRNVIIYFSAPIIRKVLRTFRDHLADDGYLFVGHAENLSTFTQDFEILMAKDTFIYAKRPVLSSARSDLALTPVPAAPVPPAEPQSPPSPELADDPKTVTHRARQCCRQDDYPNAERLLRQLLDHGTDSEEVHLLLGLACAAQGRGDEAATQAESALAKNYLSPGAHYLRGLLHLQEGQTERAALSFTRTIYSDADFALAHFKLARIREEQGDFREARRHYQNALKALASPVTEFWHDFAAGFSPELVRRSCQRGVDMCDQAIARNAGIDFSGGGR